MTNTERPFDAELAWDIQEWNEDTSHLGENVGGIMHRSEVKRLAQYLTEKGYTKGKTGLGGLLSTFEEVRDKVVEEFGPLIDTLGKGK